MATKQGPRADTAPDLLDGRRASAHKPVPTDVDRQLLDGSRGPRNTGGIKDDG
ncbi:hypothetical protein [Nocardia sp. XZ_19_369]|uniref:hypothetical protein n=1 Tax=Nocardia sp. XZ_19_369 TaxID=2769487 RepID=UPI00188F9A05|nr:hypothetical protein [Nocardia sp. XZ_19_369]